MKPTLEKPRIVWDEHKRSKNIERHGIDMTDLELFEWETAVAFEAHSGKRGEKRYKAIGFIGDRLVAFVYSLLGTEAISAISVRPASRSERRVRENL
jgi:uncharacterized DUF497 family protein